MNETSVFCEIYGNTIRNRIVEYLLENQDIDFSICDMARELNISKPKAYETISNFEKKGFVIKSRIIGKTQLIILNKQNKIVNFLLKNFQECLNLTVIENQTKNKPTVKKFAKIRS